MLISKGELHDPCFNLDDKVKMKTRESSDDAYSIRVAAYWDLWSMLEF